ncbi:helicase C-terminal domain-containing protein [Chloroflexota bacterium]
MKSIASLDIETTGLNPSKDKIIEIGVRIFDGERVIKEWSSLINPFIHIPRFISELTGITNEMVKNAPAILDVLEDLVELISDLPILGQNIRFDLSFFKKYKVLQDNPYLDTYELASVLLPKASRYNLRALTQELDIPQSGTSHRALDDARATHLVFSRLWKLGFGLPVETLYEIVHHGENLDWGANWPFREILKERRDEIPAPDFLTKPFQTMFDKKPPQFSDPILNKEVEFKPLDIQEASSFLEFGGAFSKIFESFEHRPEQIEMLKAVGESLSNGQHLLVEAGTGVGKSFAYLVPAAIFSFENKTRIIISTNTINLQDQLITQDIPDLNRALDINIRASVLKGRSNYLCPRRVELLRKRSPQSVEELRVLAKVLVWLQTNTSGDRTDIHLNGPIERDIWSHISAEDDQCSVETCLNRIGGICPFFRARQDAQTSHLLIVNHALLLTDIASGNRVLPEYEYLIVDEGHHLEDAATDALSFRFTEFESIRLLRELGSSSSGILSYLLSIAQATSKPSMFASLGKLVTRVSDISFRFENQQRAFLKTVHNFIWSLRDQNQSQQYAFQMRIVPSVRTLPDWDDIEIGWDTANDSLQSLLDALDELRKKSVDIFEGESEEAEDAISALLNNHLRILEIKNNLSALVSEPEERTVYWAEIQPNTERVSLHASPVAIGHLLEEYLWLSKTSVIVTSATLATNRTFDYIRTMLGAEIADELLLGSPFDYENSALLYLCNDIGEPHTGDYQYQLNRTIINLCQATSGRALILFTSYAQLKRTSKAISRPLAKNDIAVFEQGDGSSPSTLLEHFKNTDKSVLLGTRSFWEGVDVPGDALSVLIITKLPFGVPSDPLIASRSEEYEDPFGEYHLPEAILRFRQGFGRLIRTQSDRGIVVVLDKRILSKKYGQFFINSLPPCTKKIGSCADLPKEAINWLNI